MYTPQEALKEFRAGNRRYIKGKIIHTRRSHQRREEVALRQLPLAAIVGCSDSRVPLEVIFDQGFGDLFVIRCAGNVVGPLSLASIEFAVHNLQVPLVVVLGHTRCGAVQAALRNEPAPGHIQELIKAIRPAFKPVNVVTDALWDKAAKANVRMIVKNLKATKPILTANLKQKKLLIVGAFYDLDTGLVEFIK